MINLNISRVQLKSSVNQRVFDVPACGAFLITDYREELSDYFEIGKEVVCCRQPDELPDLIQYYLDHPEERERIAQAGYGRVVKEHTYIHRMERVVKIFSEFVRDKGRPVFSEWEDKVADDMLGQIFNELSRGYLKNRKVEEASLVLKRAVNLYPHDESFLCNLALVKSRGGQPEEAEQLYLQALSRNPDLVPALVNLGRLYSRQEELEKAERFFRQAIDESEENPPLPPFNKGGNPLSCPSLNGDPLSPPLKKKDTRGFLYETSVRLRRTRDDENRKRDSRDGCPTTNGDFVISRTGVSLVKRGFSGDNGDLVDVHAALGLISAKQDKIDACVTEAVWLADWLRFSGEVVLNNLRDFAGLFDAISAELGRHNRSVEADLTRKTADVLKSK